MAVTSRERALQTRRKVEWFAECPAVVGMCLAACRNLTSIELAVCKDFATKIVMTWQIMIWEQAQAGDKAGKTRRRSQR